MYPTLTVQHLEIKKQNSQVEQCTTQDGDVGCKARWSTSWASLEATGCRHWASASIASPWWLRWLTILVKNTQHWQKTIFRNLTYGRLRPKATRTLYPKSDRLLSSLMQQASFKCETPQLELKSSQTFLCIKRCERTKSQKVIKQLRILLKKEAYMCATSCKDVKDLDPCNMANTS